ncbi:hypothetical protein [Tenacibaculum jejuense]|uniref:Lipoprotein n=1 Tax=Tenacibaculum jejuense TaxID=584609 RepID=A0A238U5L6_9FLAO|nr:hypothetical protein [Tenacibaculum jejuense]SNR14392.1 conserved protein of unknown function [Tenacibaculum jejuense]
MKKSYYLVVLFLSFGCSNYGQLKKLARLPKLLDEVSGIEKIHGKNLFWMHNDGGNKNEIYLVNSSGKIERTVVVNAKNNDWEDITSDQKGNLYLADFGNNENIRRDLTILKINFEAVMKKKSVEVEKIQFQYPEQTKFPPKKKKRFFDAESILYYNDSLYIFTKSRVKKDYGKTSLYKIPASQGKYNAEFISSFENCSKMKCWITSSSISNNGQQVALLTSNTVLLFYDFDGDNFLKGKLKELDLGFVSQKEAIDFNDDGTKLFITDERSHGKGGKLYELDLSKKTNH